MILVSNRGPHLPRQLFPPYLFSATSCLLTPFSFHRFKDGPAVALEPSHHYGEWKFLGGVRQLAGLGCWGRVG